MPPTLNIQQISQLTPQAQIMAFNSYVETAFGELDDRPQAIFGDQIAWIRTPAEMGLPAGTIPKQFVFTFRPPQSKAQRLPAEGRTARPLSQHAIVLESDEPIVDTVKVKRTEFEADIMGVLRTVPRDLRRTAAKFIDNFLADLLRNGKTARDYRNEYFFAAGKVCSPEGMTTDTYDNLNVNNPLTETNLANAVQQGAAIRASDGLMANVVLNELLIPISLTHDAAIATLMKAIVFASGGSNAAPGQGVGTTGSAMADNPMTTILKYVRRYIVLDVLQDGQAINNTTWYLQDAVDGPTALLYGRFAPPEYVSLMDPRDTNVFFKDEYYWGWRMRENGTYGRPERIQRNEA